MGVYVNEYFNSVCYVISSRACDLERLVPLLPSLFLVISITESSSSSSSSFLQWWCTTIFIGGWQQTTTRAIRRHHCRWFYRLIIIALSRSALSFLRSSTFLLQLLPASSRRFNRSRCSDRTSNTLTTTSSSLHIHDFSQLLDFSFSTKKTSSSLFNDAVLSLSLRLPVCLTFKRNDSMIHFWTISRYLYPYLNW